MLFIDPLDGTLSYTLNELGDVTTLIGLSVASEPMIGIISSPFDDNNKFQEKVYFGYKKQHQAYMVEGQQFELINGGSLIDPQQLKTPDL